MTLFIVWADCDWSCCQRCLFIHKFGNHYLTKTASDWPEIKANDKESPWKKDRGIFFKIIFFTKLTKFSGTALDFSLFLIWHASDATNSENTSPSWNIHQQIFTIFTFASQHQKNFERCFAKCSSCAVQCFPNFEKHFLSFYRLFD